MHNRANNSLYISDNKACVLVLSLPGCQEWDHICHNLPKFPVQLWKCLVRTLPLSPYSLEGKIFTLGDQTLPLGQTPLPPAATGRRTGDTGDCVFLDIIFFVLFIKLDHALPRTRSQMPSFDNYQVFVSNLPYNCKKEALADLFGKYGKVTYPCSCSCSSSH